MAEKIYEGNIGILQCRRSYCIIYQEMIRKRGRKFERE